MANHKPKTLKQIKPAHKKGPRCEHSWLWEHTVYGLKTTYRDDGFVVHRQCGKCGVHEIAKVPAPKWSRNVRGYDLPNLK